MLTDDQRSALDRAARVLAPEDRNAFYFEVADLLADCPEMGDGSLFRILADVQKRFPLPQWGRPAR